MAKTTRARAATRRTAARRPRPTTSTAGRKPASRPARTPDPATGPPAVAAASPGPAPTGSRPPDPGRWRAKVRMYRQGLGDCFLISLTRSAQQPDYRIMIDCGVILGTPNPAAIMTKVVDDIVATTGGRVDLLLATHEHWDHLSGFIQAADSFKKLSVGEVWLAWTEDPTDPLAAQLRGERNRALAALQMAANTMRLAGDRPAAPGDIPPAGVIEDMLGFFGAAAAGGTTADALEKVRGMAKVRYCRPKDPPLELGDPDARLYVLGPPPDATLIRRTLASKNSSETYGLALDGSGVLPVDVHAALASRDDDLPFGTIHSIPNDIARGLDFFRQYYWGPGEDAPPWRSIDSDWLDSSSELALALDSATNNTSLVLAIELAGGDVLLFVADAQVGNWESWHDLSWQVAGRTVTGPDLLARTIFYKVGHHGSHNATLRDNGLALMTNLDIAAIPVNHEMAVRKRWGNMPLPELVDALATRTHGKVLRIDQSPAAPIPGVVETELYFDIML